MKKTLLELCLFGLLFMSIIYTIFPSSFKRRVVENVVELVGNICDFDTKKQTYPYYIVSTPKQTTTYQLKEETPQTYQKVVTTPKHVTKQKSVHKKKSKSYTKKSYGGQCAATTKRGTRCSRSASSGSIYCWQHQ